MEHVKLYPRCSQGVYIALVAMGSMVDPDSWRGFVGRSSPFGAEHRGDHLRGEVTVNKGETLPGNAAPKNSIARHAYPVDSPPVTYSRLRLHKNSSIRDVGHALEARLDVPRRLCGSERNLYP